MEGDKEAYLEEATKALKRQRKTIEDYFLSKKTTPTRPEQLPPEQETPEEDASGAGDSGEGERDA